jgi:hypothetical protein
MKMEITSTNSLTFVDGHLCRAWDGKTEGGIRCKVFVALIGARADDDQAELKAELFTHLAPGVVIPFSLVCD